MRTQNITPTLKRQELSAPDKETMPVTHFLETLLDRPIAFHRVFAELTNSLTAGIMLSQALYWSKRTKNSDGWFYKSREEWFTETYIQRRAQENARATLRESRFGLPSFWQEELRGVPARLYYRIDFDLLFQHLHRSHAEQSQNVPTECDVHPDLTGASLNQYAPNVPTSRDQTYQLDSTKHTNRKGRNVPAGRDETCQHSITETTTKTTTESSSNARTRAKKPAAAKSIYDQKQIKKFVIATKSHSTNPGGLARTLHQSGEEDDEITAWIAATKEREKTKLEEAERAELQQINNALDNAERFLKYGIRNQIEHVVFSHTLETLSTDPRHADVVTQLKGLSQQ